MPPVISSAVSGKKSAPKGPARRRAAPAAPRPAANAESEQQTEGALPSPAATQPERQASPPPAQPEPLATPTVEAAVPERTVTTETSDPDHAHPEIQDESQAEARTDSQRVESTSQVIEPEVEDRGATTEHAVEATTSASVPEDQPEDESQAHAIPGSEPIVPTTSPNTRKRLRETETAKKPARPAKQPKRNSTRSNAKVQAIVNAPAPATVVPTTEQEPAQDVEDTTESSSQAPAEPAAKPKPKPKPRAKAKPKPKPKAKSAATVVASEVEEDGDGDGTANGQAEASGAEATNAATQKRRRRKKTSGAARGENAETNGEGDAQGEDDGEAGNESDQSEGSNPELHEINPNTLSMFELSHDSRHGKVSEREKKMAEIDWDDVARKRREAADMVATGEKAPTEAGAQNNSTEAPDSATPAPRAESGAPAGGVQFRIVNGQIVEDESSLTIDRQAQAEANAQNDGPIEEDNDLTARINRTAWINDRRREPKERLPFSAYKSDPWSEEDTDRFYDALRMFGTDFFIISKMFPPRTRKQLKLKFGREERLDPTRINNALLGKETKPMDLEHYARESGREVSVFTKYESYEDANNAIRESMKDKEEAMHAAVKEEAENNRQEKIQQVQRDKQKAAALRKKEARQAMKRNFKGKVGAGTMGGGGDDSNDA